MNSKDSDKSSATTSSISSSSVKTKGKVFHLPPQKPATIKTTADLPRPEPEPQSHYYRLLRLARLLDAGKDKKLVITGLRMIANDLERVQGIRAARKVKVKKGRRSRV